MKTIFKITCAVIALTILAIALTGCSDLSAASTANTRTDVKNTINIGSELAAKQPTPTDISYSLERYNLIRRAYWVNGMRDKANALPCPIANMPMGYAILFTEGGSVVGQFEVDGKVSSLNSFLTPDSEYYELIYGGSSTYHNRWLADVDGSYGENDNGIFFFTVDGKYIEWSGTYLYSDIPFEIADPVINYKGEK